MASARTILLLNQSWFTKELSALGHTVVTANFRQGGADVILDRFGISLREVVEVAQAVAKRRIDVVVYLDNSMSPWLTDVHRAGVPTVFWSIDSHHHLAWHVQFARLFDITLIAQRDHLSAFDVSRCPTLWLPLWATVLSESSCERDLAASFRGTLDRSFHPERARFFEELAKLIPIDYGSGDSAKAYSRSQIVVNQIVRDDLNFRVFEAMGCGAMLLTPRSGNGLLELFEDGTELVTYTCGDVHDCAAKIRHYLDHPEERQKIALRGFQKVKAEHSPDVRAKQLSDVLESVSIRAKQGCEAAAASVLLFNYQVARTKKIVGAEALMYQALSEIVKAVTSASNEADEVLRLAIQLSLDVDSRFSAALEEIAAQLTTLYPDHPLGHVYYVAILLQQGESERARRYAEQVSNDPDQFLAAAPELLRKVREARESVIR